VVELDAIGAERRHQDHSVGGLRRQCLRVDEHLRCAARGAGLPNDALKRIRDVDIAGLVEGQALRPEFPPSPVSMNRVALPVTGLACQTIP